jgi:hypothetical protein
MMDVESLRDSAEFWQLVERNDWFLPTGVFLHQKPSF